jgi:hypothetical protein
MYKNTLVLNEVAERQASASDAEVQAADARLMKALRAVHLPFSPKHAVDAAASSSDGDPSQLQPQQPQGQPQQGAAALPNKRRTTLPPLQSKLSSGSNLGGVKKLPPETSSTGTPLHEPSGPSPYPEPDPEPETKTDREDGVDDHNNTKIDILDQDSPLPLLPPASSPYVLPDDTGRDDNHRWHPRSNLPDWSIPAASSPSSPQPQPPERCSVCTLPKSKCQCAPQNNDVAQDDPGSNMKPSFFARMFLPSSRLRPRHRKPRKRIQAIGMGRQTDACCKVVHAFDPDDEARRSLTLSPQLTGLLWLRCLCRSAAATAISLQLDEMSTTGPFMQWWWFCPSASMSNIAPALRPVVAFSFELAMLLFVLLQFNRQMRGCLKLRPLSGLVASSVLLLDVIGALIFGFTTVEDETQWILYDWIGRSMVSAVAIVCLCMTLLIDVAAWSTSAYWVLAHDRSEDGDMDGTDTPGETSGGGAAGTGVSSYRQAQLVHLRACIWPFATPPPKTPVPLRASLHFIGAMFASAVAGIVFASFAMPAIQQVRNVRAGLSWSRTPGVATATIPTLNATENISTYWTSSNDSAAATNNTTGSSPSSRSSLHASHYDILWDPQVVVTVSIILSAVVNVARMHKQLRIFLANLHALRRGDISLRSDDHVSATGIKQELGAMAATGLLGFHAGWHLGMQMFMSVSVAVLLEIMSMSIQVYREVVFVDGVLQEEGEEVGSSISGTSENEDGSSVASMFFVPTGTDGLAILSVSSIVVLFVVERYIIGSHRCLRPRHLLGCCEISLVVLHSASGLLMGILWIVWLIFFNNIFVAPFLVDCPEIIAAALLEAARNYEKHNNPVLRVSSALFRRIVGGTIAWDEDYRADEESLSAQEVAMNAAVRLFWFSIECPSFITEKDGGNASSDQPWQIMQARRVLKSFPDRLSSEQLRMLRVSFSELDADGDGTVDLRDLSCATAVVPELRGLEDDALLQIIQTVGLKHRHWNEVKKTGSLSSGPAKRFNFEEYLCFLRHRLFLCDMHHHGEGAKDVLSFGIELRRLRGQLEGAIQLQLQHRSFSPTRSARAQSPEQRQKHDARLANRAIALSKEISEMEMTVSADPPQQQQQQQHILFFLLSSYFDRQTHTSLPLPPPHFFLLLFLLLFLPFFFMFPSFFFLFLWGVPARVRITSLPHAVLGLENVDQRIPFVALSFGQRGG